MKKMLFCLVLALTMLLGTALADGISIVGEQYTDVPSVMTQDAVISFEADQECSVTLLEPYEKAIIQLEDIYDFVWEKGNRPARYYDEETQRKIQELAQVDIDILHMTEFMGITLSGDPQEIVHKEVLFDVEYYPGQLIIVVMGIEEENGEYRWYPYRGEVRTMGLIEYDVPVVEFNEMKDQKVIFHVLTDRIGARGTGTSEQSENSEHQATPSKTAQDINRVDGWSSTNGTPIDDWFRIFLVDKTRAMEEEIARLGDHIYSGKAPVEWFPQEIRNQAQLLQPQDVRIEDMMIYDIVAVMAENYKDTYGDVATQNVFASAYPVDCEMFALLGFPIEGATEAPYFEWYCLRAEAKDEPLEEEKATAQEDAQIMSEYVEIVYKQLVIPTMEEQPAMLIVFSEPIE